PNPGTINRLRTLLQNMGGVGVIQRAGVKVILEGFNSFRIRSYAKSHAKSFRMRSHKKDGGRGALAVFRLRLSNFHFPIAFFVALADNQPYFQTRTNTAPWRGTCAVNSPSNVPKSLCAQRSRT